MENFIQINANDHEVIVVTFTMLKWFLGLGIAYFASEICFSIRFFFEKD